MLGEIFMTIWRVLLSHVLWLHSTYWDLIAGFLGMLEPFGIEIEPHHFRSIGNLFFVSGLIRILGYIARKTPVGKRLIAKQEERRKKAAEEAQAAVSVAVDGESAPREIMLSAMRPKLHTSTAYTLYFTMGLVGAHHFYLHNIVYGMLHCFTGGFFGLGLFLDFFKLRKYVNAYNSKCHPDAPYCRNTTFWRVWGRIGFVICLFVGGFFVGIVKGPRILHSLEIVDLQLQDNKNPYDILEVPRGEDLDKVHKAYRKMAMKYHPDKNVDCGKACDDKMAEITQAYDNIKSWQGKGKPGAKTDSQMEQWLMNIVKDWEQLVNYLDKESQDDKAKRNDRVQSEYKKRITAVYEEFAPDKFQSMPDGHIDKLMRNNVGKEHFLYTKICDRYKVPKEHRKGMYTGKSSWADSEWGQQFSDWVKEHSM